MDLMQHLSLWVEDMELTMDSTAAIIMWVFYRSVGCNITPVAKRIVFFKEKPKASKNVRGAIAYPFAETAKSRDGKKLKNYNHQPTDFKFHSLSVKDGKMGNNSHTMVSAYNARQAGNHDFCYSHVIPRSTPAHTWQLVDQDLKAQRCPGLVLPFEPISPPRTVSMMTVDGKQQPMVETQIYSMYPTSGTLYGTEDAIDLPRIHSRATQTNKSRDPRQYSVLVKTDESLPQFEYTPVERKTSLDNTSPPVNDCISHYWNADELITEMQSVPTYPELPSVPDFSSLAVQQNNQSQHESDYDSDIPSSSREPYQSRISSATPKAVFVYNQPSQDPERGFRNAVSQAQRRRDSADPQDIAGVADNTMSIWSYLHLPMMYFYHY